MVNEYMKLAKNYSITERHLERVGNITEKSSKVIVISFMALELQVHVGSSKSRCSSVVGDKPFFCHLVYWILLMLAVRL
jgi:hypothetical protein